MYTFFLKETKLIHAFLREVTWKFLERNKKKVIELLFEHTLVCIGLFLYKFESTREECAGGL